MLPVINQMASALLEGERRLLRKRQSGRNAAGWPEVFFVSVMLVFLEMVPSMVVCSFRKSMAVDFGNPSLHQIRMQKTGFPCFFAALAGSQMDTLQWVMLQLWI